MVSVDGLKLLQLFLVLSSLMDHREYIYCDLFVIRAIRIDEPNHFILADGSIVDGNLNYFIEVVVVRV
jgi:hypothetical protein